MKYLTWGLVLVVMVLLGGIFWRIASAADTNAKTPNYPMQFYLNGRYANGDSADVLAAYPSDEDTTGKRNELTWSGGTFSSWAFAPDSTEYYDFYCNDTLITYISGRLYFANDIPEGFIDDARAFAAGIVDSAALASGAALKNLKASASGGTLDITGTDSTITRVLGDTLRGNWVYANSYLAAVGTMDASDGTLNAYGPVNMGTQGDTTTVHAVTGFLELFVAEYTLGSGAVNAVYDFDGATSGMAFFISGKGTGRRMGVAYESAGKVRINAESALATTEVKIVGFKIQ